MGAPKAYLILTMIAAAAGVAAAVLLLGGRELELRSGSVLDAPRPVGEFVLTDQHQRPFTLESLKGNWNLLFIGFSHCPDVCPTTLAIMGQVEARVRASGREVTAVFVSVDPERDTPDLLQRYVGHFSAYMLGVTGSRDQLERICSDLGFAYVKVPQGGGRYTVDHSGALALIDPQARVVGYFSPPFEVDRLVADLVRLL
jgi:protein SCO1/2